MTEIVLFAVSCWLNDWTLRICESKCLASFAFYLRQNAVSMDNESDEVKEGHSVDALALRGDEGRGTLR